MRNGAEKKATARLIEDPRVEVVPFEKAGRTLTDAHKKFRDAWLASKVRAAAATPASAGKPRPERAERPDHVGSR
jgi:hypothetical protein